MCQKRVLNQMHIFKDSREAMDSIGLSTNKSLPPPSPDQTQPSVNLSQEIHLRRPSELQHRITDETPSEAILNPFDFCTLEMTSQKRC